MENKKLNLGSAERRKEGYINVDWMSYFKPDVEHDLNKFPYPFKDNEFLEIEGHHILEHLDRPFNVMKELHRITQKDGLIIIRVPHFSRVMCHAEHFHGFDVTFPNYFNSKATGIGYFGVDLKLVSMKLKWFAFPHLLKDMGYGVFTVTTLKFLNSIISFLANLNPFFCSRIWCFWVGGFEQIEFIFKK